MSETKWTKGLWSFTGNGEIAGEDGRMIAYASVARMTREDAEGNSGEASANSRLIASAPELYEALEIARRHLQHMAAFIGADPIHTYSFEALGEDGPKIDAALLKARGQ